MLKDHFSQFTHWIGSLITEPHNELTRWERAVRYAYELCLHGWKALNRDNAWEMAAALAYRTLFALLPVVIVSSIVLRGQSTAQVESFGAAIIDALGLDRVRFVDTGVEGKTPEEVQAERVEEDAGPADSQPSTAPVQIDAVEAAQNKSVSVAELIQGIVKKGAELDLAALGWVGFLVVVYSAISLLVTIENAFNQVFGAPAGRSWSRRIPMYWLLLTLGPALIFGTLFVDRKFAGYIDNMQGWGVTLTVVKGVWGLCVVWLLMFGVYRLLPNTKVQMKAALAGSLLAALLLSVGKVALGAYFENAFSFSNLYGSLGAIPLFMFWVYLMWLAVLFGLEVAATVQMLKGRAFEEVAEKQPQNGLVDPVQVLNMMEVVTERFAQGLPTGAREITDQTCIPENLVVTMVDRLARAGVVHRVEGGETMITLARPPEDISGEKLLEIGYALVDEGGVGRVSPLVGRLREAQKRLAGQSTLASLLPEGAAGQQGQAAAT